MKIESKKRLRGFKGTAIIDGEKYNIVEIGFDYGEITVRNEDILFEISVCNVEKVCIDVIEED
ncbi:MAG: hypothetical protein ISP01_08675 [Methanobrevibacter arboriphilus]|uniref:Uncharacterized protein n=1 Tax=Methanobrevibacter arboriphilus TaxID=39441 RepID=A0A843AI87_METAZ|nr:hypothetical protein [Methanobrevibacter arboriphilus]MBF4469461.1 hypothetical protein [Methanobrevibacter arboriphilus]